MYHISGGTTSETLADLMTAIGDRCPDYAHIALVGREDDRRSARAHRYMGPLASYLPFMNADVRYAADRLTQQFGPAAVPPPATTYVPELVRQISFEEAMAEMVRP